MPVKKLKDLLDRNQIEYAIISHAPAYTAQEVAQAAHIPGDEMVKTVVVKVDGQMAMAVLPASCKVNLKLLRETIGAKEIELANEEEFRDLFPDCELGAMPPFGNLYGMKVYVARKILEDERIVFNAGSHTELIRLAYEDFEKLVGPQVIRFSSQ